MPYGTCDLTWFFVAIEESTGLHKSTHGHEVLCEHSVTIKPNRRLPCSGVYADLDFECLRPLDELLAGHTAVVARMTDEDWDQVRALSPARPLRYLHVPLSGRLPHGRPASEAQLSQCCPTCHTSFWLPCGSQHGFGWCCAQR